MSAIQELIATLTDELERAAQEGDTTTCDILHTAIADAERTAFLVGVMAADRFGGHDLLLDAVVNG